MSDASTQKRNLTAWQRWELPTFSSIQADAGALSLPTADRLEQIQQEAHDEGYQAGYAEGYQAGQQQAAQEARRLADTADALEREMQQVDAAISEDLLKLALEVARQMLQQALRVKPELLLPVVQEAIGALPHFNQHAHLVLHPADAELLRRHMGEQLAHTGWKIFEDAQIARGGCRVETANSQIDATLATRWQRVVAAIGEDDKWLAP